MAEQNQTISALSAQVMALAASRLTADVRFLSAALEALPAVPLPQADCLLATDGLAAYYAPLALLAAFKADQRRPARTLLHLALHCLLGHPFQKQEKNNALWDLACDIAVEEMIHELEIPAVTLETDADQSDWLRRLAEYAPHMTAVDLYNYLLQRRFAPPELAVLRGLFARDSHFLWHTGHSRRAAPGQKGERIRLAEQAVPGEDPIDELPPLAQDDAAEEELARRRRQTLQKQWKQLARQAQADLQTFSRRHGRRAGALMDSLATITFEQCDYGEFLRRFGAENEVMQLSDDEFDLIYYTYGLKTYGNIPLVEPLEYRDDKRIREFVIAIDTSGSVQGDIVQSFLQRTCDVLRQSASFTTRVNIYLIQCDAEVQSVEQLNSLDDLHTLIPKLKLRGFGGTDFRPVFAYVDQLLAQRVLTELGGLLYFTDGAGTYPEKAPAYKTAFIFNRDDYISPHVPPWAIRAVLTTDNIRLLNPQTPPDDSKEQQ